METCTSYDDAPVEAFQAKAAGSDTPVAPLDGELRIGAAGGSVGGAEIRAYNSLLGVPLGRLVITPEVALATIALTT